MYMLLVKPENSLVLEGGLQYVNKYGAEYKIQTLLQLKCFLGPAGE